MNKTRIFGGFSLVEMMLLLLIVSLMIASSVAVISKRHVKVPRLAMHGAFMCYYKNVNGTKQLWEERYVGSGLTKKIVDQAAAGGDHCLFTPPDKVSYLHIQATGGGGGGGDSGYKGGDPQQHKSETEVISPFGLTEEYLLEVKGITMAGDPAYANEWGTIYAYVDGTGVKGDAGDGGDLWYIHQDCANGGCLALRKWENQKTSPKEKACWNKHETVSCPDGVTYSPSSSNKCYRSETRHYSYNCWEDCKAEHYNTPKDPSYCNSKCVAYKYTDTYVPENEGDFSSCKGDSSTKWERSSGHCPSYYTLSECDYPGEPCDEDTDNNGDCTDRYYSNTPYDAVYSQPCRNCNRDCTNRPYTTYGCYSCPRQKDSEGNNTIYCASGKSSYCFSGSYERYTGYCDGRSGYYYKRNSKGHRICKNAEMVDDDRCGTGSKRWKPYGCHTKTDGAPNTSNAGVDVAYAPCKDEYNIPNTAQECTISARSSFNIWADDYYNDETNVGDKDNMYPSYRKITQSPNPTYISKRGTEPEVERYIYRSDGTKYEICNYGNTTLFSNGGIFGSFAIGLDGVNVACTTDALADAFGEGIVPLSQDYWTSDQTEFKKEESSKHYTPPIVYDVSEEFVYTDKNTGNLVDNKPYGQTEPATTVDTGTAANAAGTWNKSGSGSDMNYTNPFTGVTYKPYMSLPTACNLPKGYDDWQEHVTPKNESQCNSVRNTTAYAADRYNAYTRTKPLLISFDSPIHNQEFKPVTSWSECVDVQSTWETFSNADQSTLINEDGDVIEYPNGSNASICMLSFNDYKNDGKTQGDSATNSGGENLVDKNNGNYTVDKCSYYPLMAKGSKGGKGQSCTLGPIDGGYNLYYQGYSGILPGIRGSNAIAIANADNSDQIKALYTKSEWDSQASIYAENGTDSVGYGEIALGVGGPDETCTIHKNQQPTHGKGASKPVARGNDGADGTPDGTDGDVQGPNSNQPLGENQVGYIVTGKGENYKYKYWYTWDTNYMQYGEGGDAGEYIVKVVRAIKDKELKIFVGRGGPAGTHNSGEDGEDGGDTYIEGVLTAKGGFGGAGGLTTPVEQMPYYRDGDESDWTKGQAGTPGGRHTDLTIKSNIMNLILPVDNNFVLQQWVEASGEGGNGGGSLNKCWASGWVRNFEGTDDPKSFDEPDCRNGDYYSADPPAEDGIDGLVLIRW